MRFVFFKIASMKYYKGACELDIPHNGGTYVEENEYGHEELNFFPIEMEGDDEPMCMGFVEPKSNKNGRNTFHIERIEGCAGMKNEPCVDDVTVVWCARREQGDVTVVGWYKHATVWRSLQDWEVLWSDGSAEQRCHNVKAKASDCTLLPVTERNKAQWKVRTAKQTGSYGFGQAMVWYPDEPEAKPYLERLAYNIEHYSGENWIDKYPGK